MSRPLYALLAAVLVSHAGAASLTLPCSPPPLLRGGAVLVPTEFLSQAMGATVGGAADGIVTVRYWGHSLAFEEGKATALRTAETISLPAAPERVGEHLYVPLRALTDAVGFGFESVTANQRSLTLTFPPATLLNCRTSSEAEHVRLVYDLSSAVPFQVSRAGAKLILSLPVTAAEALANPVETGDRNCPAVTFDLTSPAAVRTGIAPTFGNPVEWFTLSAPARLVVDVQKEWTRTTVHPVVPGIEWTEIDLGTGAGPIRLNCARVDLTSGRYALRPAMTGDSIFVKDTTSRAARRLGALVAVNGGFFSSQGPPLGLVVIDRDLVRTPIYSRTCLGLTAEGEAHIGRVSTRGYLRLTNGARLPISKLNGARNGEEGLYLYTRWWDLTVPVASDEHCLSVTGGIVNHALVGGPVAVPANGYLAVGTGYLSEILTGIPAGAKLTVHFDTSSAWASMVHALGGGPMLVRDGRSYVNAQGERFRSDVTNGRAPRTAVGITAGQQVLLVTVDGRQPRYSVGMTLNELSRYLVKLGAREAMNLDGGGSTSFYLSGKIRNRPADGSERRVSNILAVVPRGDG